jgi:sterol desaturase/sphingolipid hydroxylase (fatty acid hydroxylase superfamily)
MEILTLLVVATLGHAMAALWYAAHRGRWGLCKRRIYDIEISDKQMRREFVNSLHTPIHAVLLAGCLYAGLFQARSLFSFLATLALAFVWAEIWHYVSHRAMHLKSLHWIHAEHHKSHVNSPLTAISFSFSEKLIFDAGYLGLLALVDLAVALNFYGIAAWYIGYLVINSFSHANFEFRPADYNRFLGKVITSTTYHSLHHSRYTGNYGLGTRVLDRMLGTEWEDYERLYTRVTADERPLTKLRERVD